ncbi:MAG: sigma 54-interacting transcriptional regulator, partial [Pirellulales bacterium]
MSPSRASANELGKLLGAAAEPLYLVAASRRIVFVNDACSQWLGTDAAELIGQECRYTSAVDLVGPAAVAAAICPPPEAFAGARVRVPLVPPGQGDVAPRTAEFIPILLAEETASAVLAILSAGDSEPPAVADELTATQLHARLQAFRGRLTIRYHVDRLIGDIPAMRRVRSQVKLAAASAIPVSVLGPAGSGQEHVGRAIHYGDGRGTAGPLVPLSCPLLDAELLQATFRTLARNRSSAERPATLLLEEVDTLADEGQTELFRALASGMVTARVVSTSRESLTQLADRGLFRRDLAYLLSTLTILLPPLAERMADLPPLVQWFVEQANLASAKQVGGCSPDALDRLADYAWPGNLAELEAVVAEAHRHAQGPLILPHDLPT